MYSFLTNGHLLIPSVFALISILSIIWDMVKRRSSIMLISFLMVSIPLSSVLEKYPFVISEWKIPSASLAMFSFTELGWTKKN